MKEESVFFKEQEFNTVMVFRFLILAHVSAAFPLKCPEPAQWSIRARSHCPDPSNYFCLKNDLINGYSENCTIFDFLQPGRKNVLRGGLDADICSPERYQPWPIKFFTNVSSNCIFLKSACNEEGQVVYDNGNRNTDATCRCDYTKGYDFFIKPRNPCFCIPSEEDCSCFFNMCPVLSPDYECIHSEEIMSINQCKPITAGSNNNEGNQSDADYIVREKQASTLEEYRTEMAIFVTSILSVIICLYFRFAVLIIIKTIASRCFKEHKHVTTTEDLVQIPVSVTLRKQLGIKLSRTENLYINNCIKIGNALVFTGYNNGRLIICNSDGTNIHHILLSYTPWYITNIDSNSVAVSCSEDETVLIINISTGSVTSTINTSDDCYGISYNDNNLYVVIDPSIIHVMDLTGKVIRTIPLPSDRIHDITVDRDSLICIDDTSIYYCSLDGKLIWKFEKETFQDLRRVTTDDKGKVYVTDNDTNTVVVISDDGQHFRKLLTKSDGLDVPCGIYFDKQENTLLVCNYYDGKAFLFDVKNINEHE